MSIDVSLNSRVVNIYELLRREKRVVNKADFCRALGYHTPSFAKVETNERSFPRKKFQVLAKVYGVSPEYLTEGKGPAFAQAEPVKKTIQVTHLSVDKMEDKTIVKFTDENGIENILELQLL